MIHRTKPIYKLGREFVQSNSYLKFGRNQVVNNSVRMSISANRQVAAILVSFNWTKPIFELEPEFDQSN